MTATPVGATAAEPTGPDDPAPIRALAVDAVVVLATFLLAGVLAAVLWRLLAAEVTVTRTGNGISTGEVALADRFSADGWFAVLGAAGGLLLGALATAWRRTHEVVTVLVVCAGALLASLVTRLVGGWLGPDDPASVLAHAKVGATAPDRLLVSAGAVYLAWPVAAMVGAMLVIWTVPGQRLLDRGRRGRPPVGAEGPTPGMVE